MSHGSDGTHDSSQSVNLGDSSTIYRLTFYLSQEEFFTLMADRPNLQSYVSSDIRLTYAIEVIEPHQQSPKEPKLSVQENKYQVFQVDE